MSSESETTYTPQLRFPEFSNNWDISTIGNIAKIDTGNKDTQDRVDSGKYPFFVRSNTVEKINEFAFDGEAILTSGDGVGVGKNFHYIVGKFNYHQRVYSIHNFTKPTNGKFVYYYFADKFYRRVLRLSAKNSVDSVRMSMISDMPISTPTKPEQTKIATFLTSVDNKIEQLSKKQELLGEYKKGLMQQIFSQAIRFKADDGSEFPDWEEKNVGGVLTIGSGRDYKHLNDGDIPVYGTGGYMTSVDNFLYDGESVCIGRKGTIDKPVLVDGKFWTVDTLFYTHSFVNLLPKFLFQLFKRINWKKYNEASGVPSLSKSTVEKITLNLPVKSEQQKIANFLSSIDNKIEQVGKQLDESKQFKKALLQQMFV